MKNSNCRKIIFYLYVLTIVIAFPGIIEYYSDFDILEKLAKYDYLSGWVQSIGALMAIYFTVYSFRRKDRENEIIKQQENEIKKLEAITEIIGNNFIMEKINKISSTFNNQNVGKNNFLYYEKFNDSELKTLVKGYGLCALKIQKQLIKIDEKSRIIKTLENQINSIESKYDLMEKALMPNIANKEAISEKTKVINNLKALISEDATLIKNEIDIIIKDINLY